MLDVPILLGEAGVASGANDLGMEPEAAANTAAVVGTALSWLCGKPRGLGNQFKGKTREQVEKAMDKHVKSGKLVPARGSAPGNKAYVNTKSKYSYNIDPGSASKGKKGGKEAAHIDVNYPNPKPKNVPSKKKLPIKED